MIAILRTFILIEITGCNFLLRKLPYIGFLFWPLELIALFNIQKTKDVRLRILLTKLGPTYIKLGQLLSTRPDLVGDKLAESLSHLQDRLPAFGYIKVKKIIKKELKSDIKKLFNEFKKTPVAAASISQVHEAIDMDGNRVAVKILRPRINKRFASEISFLFLVSKVLDNFQRLKRLRLIEVIKLLEKTVKTELNLTLEAAACDQFRENQAENKDIHIPKIYWDLVSEKVLVQEWIEGYKINQLRDLKKANLNLKAIARNLIICYFNQAYRDGFFHADMHPGNIIIQKNGKISFIDFGIMGKLSEADKAYVTKIIYGFVNRDYDYVAKIHRDAGFIKSNVDLKDFSLACRSIGEPIFGCKASEISIAKMLAHLFQVTEIYGMETQPQLLLLQKTLLIIEGVGAKLDPDLNIWELGEPWLKNWAKDNLSAKAEIKKRGKELIEILEDLPNLYKEFKSFNKPKESPKKDRFLCGLISGIVTTISLYIIYMV